MSDVNLLCLQEPKREDGHCGQGLPEPPGSKFVFISGVYAVSLHIQYMMLLCGQTVKPDMIFIG